MWGRLTARAQYLANYLPATPHLLAPWADGELFSPPPRFGTDLAQATHDRSANVVHLHWINGYIDLQSLRDVDPPLVWTMHDAWAYTGGCHYPERCDRYARGCGHCPQTAMPFATDASQRWFREKRAALADINVTFVAPSEWLARQAQDSEVLPCNPVTVIPNGLDVEHFRPRPRAETRDLLSLDIDATVVLLAGLDSNEPYRKGIDLLRQCLADLELSQGTVPSDAVYVAFGDARLSEFGFDDLGLDIRSLGYVSDERLRALYSTADIAVVPARYESFGQVASEAQAAGTPVVSFDATGLRDVVDHEETGYTATPYDPEALADGIRWMCADESRRRELGLAARQKAETDFAVETVVREYRELYERVIT